ncbi:MAG: phosphate acyltransferase PlsX [Streptosporangiales bacterium]|nr:phosphate acyltransferase PlsX [Streptosporangiales bacterium]
MGGDHAPRAAVDGAVQASREQGVRVVLVGQVSKVRPLLEEHRAVREIPLVHADDTLAMDAGALASWRRPRSSVAVACQLIRNGEAVALVSAGSTGAVVATASVRLRPQQGVLRPALAAVLPTRPTPTVLLDAGANADVKPEMLVQFAHLGTAYAQVALGVAAPRVALLNIGSEAGKGNKLARKTQELLSAATAGPIPLRYIGNVEGHDLLRGAADVVVTDGFTGNVALKTLEGAVRFTAAEVRGALDGGGPFAKLGTALRRSSLRDLRERLDVEAVGGAALLGLNGTVVITHGAATARGIATAAALARDLSQGRITDRVRDRIAAYRTPSWLHRRGHVEEG